MSVTTHLAWESKKKEIRKEININKQTNDKDTNKQTKTLKKESGRERKNEINKVFKTKPKKKGTNKQ